jgi:hypothetical protein
MLGIAEGRKRERQRKSTNSCERCKENPNQKEMVKERRN